MTVPNREDYAKEAAALAVVHKVLADFRACGIIKSDADATQVGMAVSDAAQHIENDVKLDVE